MKFWKRSGRPCEFFSHRETGRAACERQPAGFQGGVESFITRDRLAKVRPCRKDRSRGGRFPSVRVNQGAQSKRGNFVWMHSRSSRPDRVADSADSVPLGRWAEAGNCFRPPSCVGDGWAFLRAGAKSKLRRRPEEVAKLAKFAADCSGAI